MRTKNMKRQRKLKKARKRKEETKGTSVSKRKLK